MHTTENLPIDSDLQVRACFPPTAEAYGELDTAYRAFNTMLFNDHLPLCLITLQPRCLRVYGYYSGGRFRSNRNKDRTTDEIALNPVHFKRSKPTEILTTLAHEMVHLWQEHFGKPSRRGYHNHEWAAKMMSIGLHPSSTGKPGGAIVGQHMSDYLIPHGALAVAIDVLIENGFGISWYDRIADLIEDAEPADGTAMPSGPATIQPTRSGARVKYSCSVCALNAWAKPAVNLVCGKCQKLMLPGSRASGVQTA